MTKSPHWTPATPAEVAEIERLCRAWYASPAAADSPCIKTRQIMGLVMRIRQMERRYERLVNEQAFEGENHAD